MQSVEVAAHVLGGCSPDGEEHALTFVVAGTIGVGCTEVSEGDRPVDGGDDVAEGDLGRVPCQDVPASDPALGPHEAGPLQGQEDLLEVGLGQTGATGDVPDRDGRVGAVQRQRQQSSARVVTSGRHSHGWAS